MARKPRKARKRIAAQHRNYIMKWRKRAGLTQKKLVAMLAERVGTEQPEDPSLRLITTEASLSRMENGEQNFTMASLAAIADILSEILNEPIEPGWLLARDPTKQGTVISFIEKLDEKQSAQAVAVLEAMFGRAG